MNASLAGAGSLIVLLLALGGEAVLGEMRWLFARVPHPRLLVGETVDFLESRLNRAMRGPRSRLVRGALVVVAVLGLAIGVGVGLAWLVDWLPYLWPLELLLMISLIAQRGPYVRTAPAVRLLAEGGLVAGQEALRPLAGLGPGALDGLGLAGTVRIAALALARAFVHGVVAPCFWFALLGLPGLFLQQAVLVLAARLRGGPLDDPRYRDFGMTAGRLNDALSLLPAAIAALMIGLAAAFVPRGRPWAALAAAWRGDAGNLGGTGRGPAAAPGRAIAAALGRDPGAGPTELERARMLYAVACLINAGAIAALALLLLSV